MDISKTHFLALKEADELYRSLQQGNSRQEVAESTFLRRRWESNERYYEIRIYTDLFGQKVLTAFNGGIGNRLGQSRVVAVDGQIPTILRSIEKRRLGHKYIEVNLGIN